MKFSSFKYLFKQGLHNFRDNRLMSVASVGVVASCLIMVGISISLAINVNSFVRYLGDQNEVIIYMKEDAGQEQIDAINENLQNNREVSKFSFVSKEEALQEQMDYLGQYASLLNGYRGDNNPLPASRTSRTFASYDGVDYVSTPTELANVLITLKNVTYYAGMAILAVLFVVSMVVISNTIRLTVFARRKEISIMKYVGATNGFIRLPFVVEGILIGTVSAVITFRAVSAGYVYVFDYISRQATGFFAMLSLGMVPYTKIMPFMGLGFLLFGWIIGGMGSFISMKKYLEV